MSCFQNFSRQKFRKYSEKIFPLLVEIWWKIFKCILFWLTSNYVHIHSTWCRGSYKRKLHMLFMITILNGFSKFCCMNFVCNLSTHHDVIIISCKSCWADLSSYIIQCTYCVICNKISIFIFLENPNSG